MEGKGKKEKKKLCKKKPKLEINMFNKTEKVHIETIGCLRSNSHASVDFTFDIYHNILHSILILDIMFYGSISRKSKGNQRNVSSGKIYTRVSVKMLYVSEARYFFFFFFLVFCLLSLLMSTKYLFTIERIANSNSHSNKRLLNFRCRSNCNEKHKINKS